MRIHVNKIGSVTRNIPTHSMVTLTDKINSRAGAVIAARIINDKNTYNQLEDINGRLIKLNSKDIILGALGHRNALQGYEGMVPKSLNVGDTINILNIGGVLGICNSHNSSVGQPFEIEVLGQLLVFTEIGSRKGKPAFIQMGKTSLNDFTSKIPVIYIAGTCMNSGKTQAACTLVRHLTNEGLRVGGAKLTGVSLMRDILAMKDYGAVAVSDFTDAGVVTTSEDTAPKAARVIFQNLINRGVDVIVAETGDGIMGEYGVQAIFNDPELKSLGVITLLCANDPVGVVGGVRELRERYKVDTDIILGPATDNGVGLRFVENALGIPAINAINNPQQLADHTLLLLSKRLMHKAS